MTPERKRDEERLKRAMNYMHAHYGEHFSLEELAQQALTSRSELCRCFRRVLGIPPKEFLMQYRIQQAEILLKNSAYSIADVAEFTGKEPMCCPLALEPQYYSRVEFDEDGIVLTQASIISNLFAEPAKEYIDALKTW